VHFDTFGAACARKRIDDLRIFDCYVHIEAR